MKKIRENSGNKTVGSNKIKPGTHERGSLKVMTITFRTASPKITY